YRLQRRHSATISAFLSDFDALLLPTVSTEACDPEDTGDRRFQIPSTLLGLPAISLPTGLSQNDLPLAAQLIGQAGRDQELLALSAAVVGSYPLIGRPI